MPRRRTSQAIARQAEEAGGVTSRPAEQSVEAASARQEDEQPKKRQKLNQSDEQPLEQEQEQESQQEPQQGPKFEPQAQQEPVHGSEDQSEPGQETWPQQEPEQQPQQEADEQPDQESEQEAGQVSESPGSLFEHHTEPLSEQQPVQRRAVTYQPSTVRATERAIKHLCRYLAVFQIHADSLTLPESAKEKKAYISLLQEEILEQLKISTSPFTPQLMDYHFWVFFLHTRAISDVAGFDEAAARSVRIHAEWIRLAPPPRETGYVEEHRGAHVCRIYPFDERPSPFNHLPPPEPDARRMALSTLQTTFASIRRFFPLHGQSSLPDNLCLAVSNNLETNAYIRGWYRTPEEAQEERALTSLLDGM